MRKAPGLTAPRLLLLSSAAFLLLGAWLLALPVSSADGAWHFDVPRLCLAASAVCVTGLDPVGIGTALSPFGWCVLTLLVQVGGIGILTFGTLLFRMVGHSLSVSEEQSVTASLGEARRNRLGGILRATMLFTAVAEGLGFLVLLWRFAGAGAAAGSFAEALSRSAFFAIMAFCNAGFSPYPGSVAPFADDPIVLHTISCLSLVGGLGFIVIENLLSYRPWRRDRTRSGRLSLHSRIVLQTTAVLFAVCLGSVLVLERTGAFAGLPLSRALSLSFFHAASVQACGFSAFPVETLSAPSLLLAMAFMFIGGSPGSTAGGLKVTTLVVLAATVRANILGRWTPELQARSIPRDIVNAAVTLLFLSLAIVFTAALLLILFEAHNPALSPARLLFVSVSAFGNCGLEPAGQTRQLSDPSLLVLSLVMFFARLGPITIGMTFFRSRRIDRTKRYPEENLVVG